MCEASNILTDGEKFRTPPDVVLHHTEFFKAKTEKRPKEKGNAPSQFLDLYLIGIILELRD
jgi:hypothetical protein